MLVSIIAAKTMGGFIVNDVELSGLFGMILYAFFANCVKNIFEEFTWRGCLVPYLEKTGMNDWFLYLVIGFVWGFWHITYYLFFLPDEYFTETSRPMMAVAGIIPIALVFASGLVLRKNRTFQPASENILRFK